MREFAHGPRRRLNLSSDCASNHSVYQTPGSVRRRRSRAARRRADLPSRDASKIGPTRSPPAAGGGRLRQPGRRDAAAVRAIGRPAELARRDPVLEVRRDTGASSARRCSRRATWAGSRTPLIRPRGICSFWYAGRSAIRSVTTRSRSRAELLVGRFADLRRIQTEPDLLDVVARGPEADELLEIAVAAAPAAV